MVPDIWPDIDPTDEGFFLVSLSSWRPGLAEVTSVRPLQAVFQCKEPLFWDWKLELVLSEVYETTLVLKLYREKIMST